MAQQELFHPPADFVETAHIKSYEQYKQMYDRSINDPEGFWAEIFSCNPRRKFNRSVVAKCTCFFISMTDQAFNSRSNLCSTVD